MIDRRIEKIAFSFTEPQSDRLFHITPDDIRVVLSRIPYEHWQRLKAVHFNDRSWGGRTLGYVTSGRKEISVCALPPRMSLSRFLVKGQTPEEFGAVRGAQWPELAIRRFLLYDVFLHEVGHLQIINEKSKSVMKKFAREGKASEFALHWYRKLWREPFPHPDPVHNKPTKEEIRKVKKNLGSR